MLAGTNGLFSLLFAVEAVKMLTEKCLRFRKWKFCHFTHSFLEEDLWTNSFTQECEVNHAGCWNSKLCASCYVCAARTVNWSN